MQLTAHEVDQVQSTAHKGLLADALYIEGRSYRGHHVEMAHTKSRHKLERERREALDEIERLERPKRMKSKRKVRLPLPGARL